MKSKEEMQKEIWMDALQTERGSTNSALKAMDIWAKQEAIALANYTRQYEKLHLGGWTKNKYSTEMVAYTTEELYELYLNQTK